MGTFFNCFSLEMRITEIGFYTRIHTESDEQESGENNAIQKRKNSTI